MARHRIEILLLVAAITSGAALTYPPLAVAGCVMGLAALALLNLERRTPSQPPAPKPDLDHYHYRIETDYPVNTVTDHPGRYQRALDWAFSLKSGNAVKDWREIRIIREGPFGDVVVHTYRQAAA